MTNGISAQVDGKLSPVGSNWRQDRPQTGVNAIYSKIDQLVDFVDIGAAAGLITAAFNHRPLLTGTS